MILIRSHCPVNECVNGCLLDLKVLFHYTSIKLRNLQETDEERIQSDAAETVYTEFNFKPSINYVFKRF